MSIQLLLGKILSKIDKSQDEITFTTDDGMQFKMYHEQDCCESVGIEDVSGDLDDLIGTSITLAEESQSSERTAKQIAEKEAAGDNYYYEDESFTWTFYKLATIKGYVDIRWYGSSNGYYSESVDVREMNSNQDY